MVCSRTVSRDNVVFVLIPPDHDVVHYLCRSLAETHRSDESGENFRMPDRFNAGAHQSFETVRLASDGYFQCAHEALWSSDSKQKQNYQ